MLEINARPLRDLKALIELIGQHRVERELNVHRTTVFRWLKGEVKIPGHQHQVIRMLLGDLPGTCGKWTGWRFHNGQLVNDAGNAFNPGDILALIFLRQQLAAQRREIEALKIRLAVTEEAERRHSGAANEDLAVRA